MRIKNWRLQQCPCQQSKKGVIYWSGITRDSRRMFPPVFCTHMQFWFTLLPSSFATSLSVFACYALFLWSPWNRSLRLTKTYCPGGPGVYGQRTNSERSSGTMMDWACSTCEVGCFPNTWWVRSFHQHVVWTIFWGKFLNLACVCQRVYIYLYCFFACDRPVDKHRNWVGLPPHHGGLLLAIAVVGGTWRTRLKCSDLFWTF